MAEIPVLGFFEEVLLKYNGRQFRALGVRDQGSLLKVVRIQSGSEGIAARQLQRGYLELTAALC
jgi:hypothetical protein